MVFDPRGRSTWSPSKDMRRLEADLGDVHYGDTRELSETLIVRTGGVGAYEIGWTLYVKSPRRHCKGTITLVVPPTPPASPARPAFGTIEGITRFPDVPLIGEDGDIVADARIEDPSIEPPREPKGDGFQEQVAAMAAARDWYALGFDDEPVAS